MTPNKKTRRRNPSAAATTQPVQQIQQAQQIQQQYHQQHQYTQTPQQTPAMIPPGYDPVALLAAVSSQAAELTSINDALNLRVLRRHWPDTEVLVTTAPYAVVYIFAPTTQTWEKSGIEGTLFITAYKTPTQPPEEESYRVSVLNRRGLDNFSAELGGPEYVDVTPEYIIIKSADDAQIYGLWIFAEPPPSSTADLRSMCALIMVECANRAADSRKVIADRQSEALERALVTSQPSPAVAPDLGGEPMGRQLSLRELFGQNREADSGFAMHNHSSVEGSRALAVEEPAVLSRVAPPVPLHPPAVQQGQSNRITQGDGAAQGGGVPLSNGVKSSPAPGMFMTNPDTEFFRAARTPSRSTPAVQSNGDGTTPMQAQQVAGGTSIAIQDLFRAQQQGR
ncbi:PH domain-like protein [Microthyrium microscopicum]|uniref:PH domain-like protein n=1 Tax=Microthyrium microscopicum TaxID=703497 RepID=A0A6A6UDH9_9PEZI|nr:PH domain-like protein [Microthyrium microscopicum]